MYITLRYAKNWAAGFGILWNVGEPPVEGYSNFSFLVLGRLALLANLNPVFVLKSAGAFGLCLTCIAIYRLSRFWFTVRIALIPCLWLLAYKGQIIWSVSGLETTLYEALIVFSVFFLVKGLGYRAYPDQPCAYHYIDFVFAGILLAFASMTRPEAPALLALFVLILLCDARFGSRPKTSSTTHRIGINNKGAFLLTTTFLLCFLPYFVWRWHFFGRLFPNPVYCKGLDGSMNFILDKHYLLLIWPFILLSIPAVYKSTDVRQYFLWLPSILYSVLLINASELVAFDNRFFLPAFVLLLQGIEIMLFWLLKNLRVCKYTFASYFAATLVLMLFIPMMTLKGYSYFSLNPLAGERLRGRVLEWLEQNTNSESIVVLADSGMIPYRSSLRYIDSYCLNNALMTQSPRAEMYSNFCKQILITEPDVIVLTSLLKHRHVTYTPADACLIQSLKSSADYMLQASLSTGDDRSLYQYEIYQLKRNENVHTA